MQAPEIDLSVIVMTSTFWPMSHSASSCALPDTMVKSCKSFEQFYLSRHSGRRLTWQPSLGNADVRVAFKARKHDLNVSTFALVILLLFEDVAEGEFLTYSVNIQLYCYDGSLTRGCKLGNQSCYVDSRRRAAAAPPVARLRQVQDFEETSSEPGCEPGRLVLV